MNHNDVSPLCRESRDFDRAFAMVVAALLLWRIVIIAIVPYDLFSDESYYWEWARRLDWGYFSKPPMIAWLIAASTGLLGHSDVAVRLPAVVLSTAALIPLYLFARDMFDARTAFWATVALMLTPLNVSLSTFMTTDSPLNLLWATALYASWRAINGAGPKAWIAAGVTVAAGLLAKQMMVVFPVLLFGFLILSPPHRRHLKSPLPYLFLALSACGLIPILLWNAKHQWITMQHTAHHFAPGSRGTFAFAGLCAEFLGSQLGVISPVLFVLLIAVAAKKLRSFRTLADRDLFLLLFGAVPLVVFVLMSLRQRMNPNWPSVYYQTSLVLLAAWGTRSRREWKIFSKGVMVAGVMAALTYALPWLVMATGLEGGKLDLTRRMRGWKELARQVGEARREFPAAPEGTFILSPDKDLVSELAFYLPDHPRTYHWPAPDRVVRSQYELWPGPEKGVQRDALVVARGPAMPWGLPDAFKEVVPYKTVTVRVGAATETYQLYLAKELTDWPAPKRANQVQPVPAAH